MKALIKAVRLSKSYHKRGGGNLHALNDVSLDFFPGEVLRLVGESGCGKSTHAFRGGQRQRIGIARAIAMRPDFLVCDEAVSALDVSVRAQILNLLADLNRQMNLSMLFVSHDISVVRYTSHRIAVMYRGSIVELGNDSHIFEHTAHSYTKALLLAVPRPDPDVPLPVLEGNVKDEPTDLPTTIFLRTHLYCRKSLK
jgi:ABC-type oligopeptide transport system ATPase subunit